MRYGVIFPNGELGEGPDGPRRLVQAVEEFGFDYLAAPDHVLGADASTRPDWTGQYDAENVISEVFVLLGFFAALTKLELATTVLVLPQRQTAVVAKQAAELDVLTRGKLRLGTAVGWNPVEYEALGIDFRSRGALFEEQLEVLRLLWTQHVVTFEGRFHHIDRAGICPLPVQQPIPLWVGGYDQRSAPPGPPSGNRILDRIGRLADGWMCALKDAHQIALTFEEIRRCAQRAGRDADAIGLQTSLNVTDAGQLDAMCRDIEERRAIGVTHITMQTRHGGLSLEQHIELLGKIGDVLQRLG